MVKNYFFTIENPFTGFFGPSSTQNGHLKTIGPVSVVKAKNGKMDQNHTFWWSIISKLGQHVVCSYFVCWKLSNHENESGNTVFWFFPFFWSVVNLAGVFCLKLDFCTRFRTFGSNPEDLDHKTNMLNGETHLKVSKRFFWAKKNFMSQIDQEGLKIISSQKIFFP